MLVVIKNNMLAEIVRNSEDYDCEICKFNQLGSTDSYLRINIAVVCIDIDYKNTWLIHSTKNTQVQPAPKPGTFLWITLKSPLVENGGLILMIKFIWIYQRPCYNQTIRDDKNWDVTYQTECNIVIEIQRRTWPSSTGLVWAETQMRSSLCTALTASFSMWII